MEQYLQKERTIEEIKKVIPDGADIIIPLGNGEPDAILTEIDTHLGTPQPKTMRYRGLGQHRLPVLL